MKRLFSLLAVALLLPMVAFAQVPCPQPTSDYTPVASRYSKGLLFRLEQCGKPVGFIVGTIHLDNPATLKMYDRLVALLPQVGRVGFEFVDTERTASIAATYMFFPANTTKDLSKLLTPEEFNAVAKVLTDRLQQPRNVVKFMRPWAASILMQFPKPVADGVALDKRLQTAAQGAGIEVFGLETPQEQYDVFANIPEEKQVIMLRDTIQEMDTSDTMNAQFLAGYVAEDLNVLEKLAADAFEMNTDAELKVYLKSHLIDKRNAVMVERLAPQLRTDTQTLTAIGALHLMGDQGVLKLLEAKGYRIYPE